MNERFHFNLRGYFRNIRIRRRITFRELEEVSGYSNSYWCMLECGKREWNKHLVEVYHASMRSVLMRRGKRLNEKMGSGSV